MMPNTLDEHNTPDYGDEVTAIATSPTRWEPLPEEWRGGVAQTAMLAYQNGQKEPSSDAVTLLALAWTHPACRPVILNLQPDYTSKRQTDAFARLLTGRYAAMRQTYTYLPDVDRDGYAVAPTADALAPRLTPLETARDEPEPASVLWRDADGRFTDAVLSVGEVALLSGEGGLGKSYVTLALAVAGALAADLKLNHGAACGLRVAPSPVVLVSYEDAPARMFGRLRRMGNEEEAVHLHTARHPMPLWTADGNRGGASRAAAWWDDLWRYVREVGARLVVIDPASAALADVSPGESGPVRAFFRELTAEADRAAAGVLIVTHSTKAARNAVRTGDDPGAGVVSGSAAWYDGARGVLTLTALPDNPAARILECVKANYGRKGWAAVLHEFTTDRGDFAGLQFQGGPGDRIDDMRTWATDRKSGGGRNGKPDTSFDHGANAATGEL